MKNLVFVLLLLVFASCDNVEIKPGPGPLVSPAETEVKEVEKTKPFSDPAIIYGTDFGNFFKTLYEQGKYDEMIKFTSTESLDLYGQNVIRDFYKNDLKFGYEIGKPHSQTVEDDVITLNYNANIIATKRVIRINIVLENDSCKIVLPDKLKNFPS